MRRRSVRDELAGESSQRRVADIEFGKEKRYFSCAEIEY